MSTKVVKKTLTDLPLYDVIPSSSGSLHYREGTTDYRLPMSSLASWVTLALETGAGMVGTLSGKNVEERFTQIEAYTRGYITPEMYYDSTVTDHTTAITMAITEALSSKRRLVFNPSVDYTVTSRIAVSLGQGDKLDIDFQNANIIQAANTTVFLFQNTLVGTVTAVTGLSTASVDLSVGSNVNSFVSVIVAPGHGFTKVGQVGRIYSDDPTPDPDSNTVKQRIGEWFTVSKIDGNTIYCTGALIETYTTGIFVCVPSTAELSLANLSGSSTWSDNINSAYITVQGFITPVERGVWKATDLNATFLSNTSCYMADCQATIIGHRLKNSTTLGAYGYLVNDSGSYGSQYHSINAQYTRHAFTTTTPNSEVGDGNWNARGRSMLCKVMNCVVQGNACGIDTHAPAYNIHFGTITCIQDYRGDGAGGVGLQIRANTVRIDTLQAINCKVGLFVSGAAKTTPSRASIGCLKIKSGQGCLPITISGNGTYLNKVSIDSADIETDNNVMCSVTNARVIFNNLNAVMTPYANGAYLFDLNTGAYVECRAGDIEMKSGNSHFLASHNDTGTVCLAKLSLTGGSLVSYLAKSASQYDVQSEWQVTTDAWAGTPFLGLPTTGAKAWAKIRLGATGYPLGYRAIEIKDATVTSINLQNAGDDSIFVRFLVSVAATTVVISSITSVTKGAFPGQRLILNNHTGSLQTITIANGSSGLLTLGSAVTLAVGSSFTFVWDGSTWRRGQ